MLISTLVFCLLASTVSANGRKNWSSEDGKDGKALSVFNVVRFPNTVCASLNNFNGTCYTSSECSSLGGSPSGTCASSFGVCCVFSLACGGSSSANATYSIIDSYSTSTDSDPCTYTYCKNNVDVCKLRIDFDTMVLAPPVTTNAAATDGINIGHCNTDTLAVGVPGYNSPPIICGYNTGQHMWVPASDSCVTITLDIDTATTTTTRKWSIRVTQYECGNLNAPEQNCLQYHTATTGKFASFNYDTSKTANTKTELYTQFHLADQHYSICIRRTTGYCSICYSPQLIHSSTITAIEGSSFGLSAAHTPPVATNTVANGPSCTGRTTSNPTAASASGFGDYITIENAQNGVGASTTLGTDRLCGILFSAAAVTTTVTATVCSYVAPFKVGVHFDSQEAIGAGTPVVTAANNWGAIENAYSPPTTLGEGIGHAGFYLAYWQTVC